MLGVSISQHPRSITEICAFAAKNSQTVETDREKLTNLGIIGSPFRLG
jgi:predicted transcriptional regulator